MLNNNIDNYKDAVGLRYDSNKDKDLWDYAISLKYKPEADDKLRRQALALSRIRDIVQKGIEKCDAKFDGIKLINGELVQSTSSIKDNGIRAENILGGHSGRVYFDLPKEYNEKILDIVSNGNTSHTVYGSLINSLRSGSPLKSYDEAVYPRFAATHGVEEKEGKIIEKKLSATSSAFKGSQGFFIGNSTHYGVDFVQKDEEKIVSDGTVGHLYINTDSTEKRSAIGFGLEGSAPMTGGHSMSGGADRYSAFGGPKCYVKVEKSTKKQSSFLGLGGTVSDEMKGNSKDYISDICKEYSIQNITEVENKILEAQKSIDADRKNEKNKEVIFKKIEICNEKNIYVVNTAGDKNTYIVTEYAMKQLEKGHTIPKYIDGMKIRVEEENHKDFLDSIDRQLNEIKEGKNIDSKVVNFLKKYDNHRNMFEAIDKNFNIDELQKISDKLIDHPVHERLSKFIEVLQNIKDQDLTPSEVFLEKFSEEFKKEFLENIDNLSNKDQELFQTLLNYLKDLYNSIFGVQKEEKDVAEGLTLHNAAKSNSLALTEFLINNSNKGINERDQDGNTALYYALTNNNNDKNSVARFLVENEANELGENADEILIKDKYSNIVKDVHVDPEIESIESDVENDIKSLGNSSDKLGEGMQNKGDTKWVDKILKEENNKNISLL